MEALNPTNIVPNQVGAIWSPLYDTYEKAQNTQLPATITFFGNLASSVGLQNTNMPAAYELGTGESFDVYALRFVFIDTYVQDIYKVFKNYVAELYIGERPYLQAPLEFFPGGAGVTGFAALSTTATTTTLRENVFNNGIPDPRAINSLTPPYILRIAQGMKFSVKLSTTATPPTLTATASNGTNLFMRCYLDGLRRRLAQG
jgi:hypothetical protein